MTLLYLLDANDLVDANRDYYPIERVPEFWHWLAAMGRLGRVKIPQEIYEEFVRPRPDPPDHLVEWLVAHREELLFDEQAEVTLVANVTEAGYGEDLTEDEIGKVGRDPFLTAYAVAGIPHRSVVTNERSRPGRTRANRHLPDVCDDFNVRCINAFELIKELDFRTNWRATT